MPWFTAINGGDTELRCTGPRHPAPAPDTYKAVYTEL